jgi:hypothetical protein
MAQRNGGITCFELLCPELLDIVAEKVVQSDPSFLNQLAKVNRAFRDVVRSRSQTLVIQRFKKKSRKALQPDQLCSVLSKEMGMHPNIVRLVLKGGAPTSILPGVSSIQWSSVIIGACMPPLSACVCLQHLSASKTSLRSLDLTNSGFDLYQDICCIVDFFPNLEDLTLRGGPRAIGLLACIRGPQRDYKFSGLKRLDVSHLQGREIFTLAYLLTRVLRSIESISTLKASVFDYRQLYNPDSFLSPSLKSLHLELVELGLSNSILQSVAEQCPSLEQLLIRAGWDNARISPQAHLDVFSVLRKCPNLEHLIISRVDTAVAPEFRSRVATYVKGPMKAPLSKVIIERVKSLDDVVREDPAGVANLKEFTIFSAMVVDTSAATFHQSKPNIRKHLVGETAAVQSRCDVFCAENGRV